MSESEVQALKATDPNDRQATKSISISQESIENMNNTLIANINNAVSDSDELYILGDFAFVRNFSDIVILRQKIKCKNVHLIFGNHDRFSKREYRSVFSSAQDYLKISVDGIRVIIFHYPILRWDSGHYGSIHCFGHCHGTLNKYLETTMTDMRMLDVGVDSNSYLPWHLPDIVTLMGKKKAFVKNEGEKQ